MTKKFITFKRYRSISDTTGNQRKQTDCAVELLAASNIFVECSSHAYGNLGSNYTACDIELEYYRYGLPHNLVPLVIKS